MTWFGLTFPFGTPRTEVRKRLSLRHKPLLTSRRGFPEWTTERVKIKINGHSKDTSHSVDVRYGRRTSPGPITNFTDVSPQSFGKQVRPKWSICHSFAVSGRPRATVQTGPSATQTFRLGTDVLDGASRRSTGVGVEGYSVRRHDWYRRYKSLGVRKLNSTSNTLHEVRRTVSF